MEFNNRSRKVNALLGSSSGVILQVVQILSNFIYRTIFLTILTKEYLGINGLFSNVLQLFSLTELGIGTAILYSMYKPFAEKDVKKIGALVHFFKKVYILVTLAVVGLSLLCYPFIGMLVDSSGVPGDVNLTLVYFLFVLQSITDYLFAYKQVVLTADQKPYITAAFTGIMTLAGYGARVAALLITKDYEITLLCGILSNLLLNAVFAAWITGKYQTVFQTKGLVSREEKKQIYKNTIGLMFHKVGSIVVFGTDNIILTKFVSLAATGIYSNYSLIVSAISTVIQRIFQGVLPIVTNFTVTKSREESHELFNKLLYANLWMCSFTTVCLFVLLNPFITLWLGQDFLFDTGVVAVLCFQYYLTVSRMAANNFISSCGLFARDKIRPLIESLINIVTSIWLVKEIGIAGIFVGSCISGLCTCYWREPYIVFKHSFQKGMAGYWLTQLLWFLLTAAMCVGGMWLCSGIPNTILGFLGKMMVAGIGSNAVILLTTCGTKEFRYFASIVKNKLR